MAEIIAPRYGYIPQAEAYPPEEWTWRGIIYPGVFEGTTSFIQYKFDSIKRDLATGAAYYTNYGTDGLHYNAPAQGSNHIWLNGTDQSVDLPIPYELGTNTVDVNTFVTNDDETTTYIKNSSTSFDLAVTVAGTSITYPRLRVSNVPDVGRTILSFNAVVTSGTPVIERITTGGDAFVAQHTIVNGYNAIEFEVFATGNTSLYFNGLNAFDISVTGMALQEVTNTNSYATYYDVDTKAFKTIDNPVGTTYNMTDSFSSYFTTDVPVTEADRSYLTSNPEALYSMWFGEPVVGLSFNKANMINFIPGTEGVQGGAYLQDLSVNLGVELAITPLPYGTNTITDNLDGTYTVEYVDDSRGFQMDFATTIGKEYIVTINTIATDYTGGSYVIANPITPVKFASETGIGTLVFTATLATSKLRGNSLSPIGGKFTFSTSVREATVYEIANYLDTCRTTLVNTNYGASNFALIQDGSGRATGRGLANTQNFPPYDDSRYASTGFLPDIGTYSIEETVTGELQDFGSDVVVNGTFDTDISGWSTSGGTSVWSSDNGGSIETTPTGTTALIYQSVPTSTAQWLVTFKIKCEVSLGSVNVRTGSVSESIGTYTNTGNYETYTHVIFSNSTYDYIQIGSIGGSTASEPIYFDDVTMEELTTKTQRTEQRLLTHTDAIPETKYYINGVEQAITPPLPDPLVDIDLNNTAVIGYPGPIDSRLANFEIHDEVLIP